MFVFYNFNYNFQDTIVCQWVPIKNADDSHSLRPGEEIICKRYESANVDCMHLLKASTIALFFQMGWHPNLLPHLGIEPILETVRPFGGHVKGVHRLTIPLLKAHQDLQSVILERRKIAILGNTSPDYFSDDFLLEVAISCLKALQHCHSQQGFVHGNVKLSNIFLTQGTHRLLQGVIKSRRRDGTYSLPPSWNATPDAQLSRWKRSRKLLASISSSLSHFIPKHTSSLPNIPPPTVSEGLQPIVLGFPRICMPGISIKYSMIPEKYQAQHRNPCEIVDLGFDNSKYDPGSPTGDLKSPTNNSLILKNSLHHEGLFSRSPTQNNLANTHLSSYNQTMSILNQNRVSFASPSPYNQFHSHVSARSRSTLDPHNTEQLQTEAHILLGHLAPHASPIIPLSSPIPCPSDDLIALGLSLLHLTNLSLPSEISDSDISQILDEKNSAESLHILIKSFLSRKTIAHVSNDWRPPIVSDEWISFLALFFYPPYSAPLIDDLLDHPLVIPFVSPSAALPPSTRPCVHCLRSLGDAYKRDAQNQLLDQRLKQCEEYFTSLHHSATQQLLAQQQLLQQQQQQQLLQQQNLASANGNKGVGASAGIKADQMNMIGFLEDSNTMISSSNFESGASSNGQLLRKSIESAYAADSPAIAPTLNSDGSNLYTQNQWDNSNYPQNINVVNSFNPNNDNQTQQQQQQLPMTVTKNPNVFSFNNEDSFQNSSDAVLSTSLQQNSKHQSSPSNIINNLSDFDLLIIRSSASHPLFYAPPACLILLKHLGLSSFVKDVALPPTMPPALTSVDLTGQSDKLATRKNNSLMRSLRSPELMTGINFEKTRMNNSCLDTEGLVLLPKAELFDVEADVEMSNECDMINEGIENRMTHFVSRYPNYVHLRGNTIILPSLTQYLCRTCADPLMNANNANTNRQVIHDEVKENKLSVNNLPSTHERRPSKISSTSSNNNHLSAANSPHHSIPNGAFHLKGRSYSVAQIISEEIAPHSSHLPLNSPSSNNSSQSVLSGYIEYYHNDQYLPGRTPSLPNEYMVYPIQTLLSSGADLRGSPWWIPPPTILKTTDVHYLTQEKKKTEWNIIDESVSSFNHKVFPPYVMSGTNFAYPSAPPSLLSDSFLQVFFEKTPINFHGLQTEFLPSPPILNEELAAQFEPEPFHPTLSDRISFALDRGPASFLNHVLTDVLFTQFGIFIDKVKKTHPDLASSCLREIDLLEISKKIALNMSISPLAWFLIEAVYLSALSNELQCTSSLQSSLTNVVTKPEFASDSINQPSIWTGKGLNKTSSEHIIYFTNPFLTASSFPCELQKLMQHVALISSNSSYLPVGDTKNSRVLLSASLKFLMETKSTNCISLDTAPPVRLWLADALSRIAMRNHASPSKFAASLHSNPNLVGAAALSNSILVLRGYLNAAREIFQFFTERPEDFTPHNHQTIEKRHIKYKGDIALLNTRITKMFKAGNDVSVAEFSPQRPSTPLMGLGELFLCVEVLQVNLEALLKTLGAPTQHSNVRYKENSMNISSELNSSIYGGIGSSYLSMKPLRADKRRDSSQLKSPENLLSENTCPVFHVGQLPMSPANRKMYPDNPPVCLPTTNVSVLLHGAQGRSPLVHSRAKTNSSLIPVRSYDTEDFDFTQNTLSHPNLSFESKKVDATNFRSATNSVHAVAYERHEQALQAGDALSLCGLGEFYRLTGSLYAAKFLTSGAWTATSLLQYAGPDLPTAKSLFQEAINVAPDLELCGERLSRIDKSER